MANGFGNGSYGSGRFGQWSYIDGAATISSAATMAVAGAIVKPASATISAAATVTAAGTRIQQGAANPQSTATVSVSAQAIKVGAASISASGTVSVAGHGWSGYRCGCFGYHHSFFDRHMYGGRDPRRNSNNHLHKFHGCRRSNQMDKGISGLDQLQRTIRSFNHMDTTIKRFNKLERSCIGTDNG